MNSYPRTKIAVLLFLIVASSGCAGIASDNTNSTTTGPNAATGATTTESTTGPVYDLPLSNDELADGNEKVLRGAGSFTAVEHYRLRSEDSDDQQWINTTTRADVETGQLYRVQNQSGTTGSQSVRTYITKSGTGYDRTSVGTDFGVSYSRSISTDLLSTSLRPNLTQYVEHARFKYGGVESVDGTKTSHYVAPNLSVFTADEDGNVIGFPREKLANASVNLYVTDDGLLKRFDVRFVARTSSGKIEGRMVSTYRNLGTTTVPQPSWLSDAKDHVSTTNWTNDSKRVTQTVRNSSLGASVTATGPRYAVEGVELERQTGGIWDTDGEGFRKAQISALVRVWTPQNASPKEIELSYDDSEVSDEKSDAVIYRYDRDSQTFVRLSTAVDADTDVAHADIDGDGTYLVMNAETWKSLWE